MQAKFSGVWEVIFLALISGGSLLSVRECRTGAKTISFAANKLWLRWAAGPLWNATSKQQAAIPETFLCRIVYSCKSSTGFCQFNLTKDREVSHRQQCH
jgi:hypothetical protein